jgi:transcriptional regulator with XRE-family HTH domain
MPTDRLSGRLGDVLGPLVDARGGAYRVAEAAELHPATVYRILRGQLDPSLGVLESLAAGLGTSVPALYRRLAALETAGRAASSS